MLASAPPLVAHNQPLKCLGSRGPLCRGPSRPSAFLSTPHPHRRACPPQCPLLPLLCAAFLPAQPMVAGTSRLFTSASPTLCRLSAPSRDSACPRTSHPHSVPNSHRPVVGQRPLVRLWPCHSTASYSWPVWPQRPCSRPWQTPNPPSLLSESINADIVPRAKPGDALEHPQSPPARSG